MKIGIVGFGNLSIMQYLFKYTGVLDREKVDYDVIYWNRLGIEENPEMTGRKIPYNVPSNTFQAFHKKVLAFLRYARFVRKTIRKNRYDKLIVLTTPTAIVLWDLLLGKYRKNYIYDYRDITKETKLRPYKWMVKKLIASSCVTMMSSKGFIKALGLENAENVMMAHNTHRAAGQTYGVKLSRKKPLRIVFWGIIRQLDFNQKVCDHFGNDERFQLVYHGTGFYEQLESYCKEKGYRNVTFTGRFALEDVPGFVEQTDILHSLYENSFSQQPAMPVKLYDALEFRLPILISAGSHLAQVMQDVAGSYVLDVENQTNVADMVYSWYESLSVDAVESDYKRMEESVKEDDRRFAEKVRAFCQ